MWPVGVLTAAPQTPVVSGVHSDHSVTSKLTFSVSTRGQFGGGVEHQAQGRADKIWAEATESQCRRAERRDRVDGSSQQAEDTLGTVRG